MSSPARPSEHVHAKSLRAMVTGTVIAPADAGYDTARTLFYGWLDRRPAAIVRVAGAHDVAATVLYARQHALPISVRSGGHSVVGHSVCNKGIVIDLSAMRALTIDVPGRTVWAETGLTAGQFVAATSEHGLATGFGDTGTVGIGGITLGGGMGFLSRKFGLTIDELLAAEMVLADGSRVIADADHHPELFWAIRGGGGNFGVATRFRFRLREVDRVIGGILFQPATADALVRVIRLAEESSEETSMIVNAGMMPPMPFLPSESHGRPVLMTMMVHCGKLEDGEKAAARLRAIAPPYADMVKPMRYREMFEGPESPHPTAASSRSMFMHQFDRSDADAIMDALQRSTASMRVTQLRVLGGAVSRVPSDATAYAHRDQKILANVAALYESPTSSRDHDAWVALLSDRLRKGNHAVYVNFLGAEGDDRIRHAYPSPTYERLSSIKASYDPENSFRGNHNIVPARS